jgi:hypothetical protein
MKQPLGALLAACLVVVGSVSLQPLIVQEATPSLVAWTAEMPLAALLSTASARSEKRLHAERVSLKRPLRLARMLAACEPVSAPKPASLVKASRPRFPRRSLPSGRAPSRSPDDPSH